MAERGVDAYVGVGSNIDGPAEHVRQALSALARLPRTREAARSSLYRSAPMGPAEQPDYVNAAARLRTALTAHALLDALLAVEADHGRVRGGERWGPRTLDLDILVYGDRVIRDARLTIPHPGIAERAFVLYPLQEIHPGLEIPGYGALRTLVARCPAAGLQRMDCPAVES